MLRSRQLLVSCGALMLGAAISPLSARAADPPAPPARSEVRQVLAAARADQPLETPLRDLTLLLLADAKDHGPGEHDYPRWQSRWALLLGGESASTEPAANLAGPDLPDAALAAGAPHVHLVTARPWPSAEQWASADVVVAFCYIAWDAERIAQVRRFLQRGGGLVVIHSATWTQPAFSEELADLTGVGGFTKYRHGSIKLTITQPDNPICAGLPRTIPLEDESYFPPTPPLHADRVHVLATSEEEPDTGSHEPSAQPMFWTYEPGKGRVFGCVLGHNNFTFDHPYFRLLLLRGIAWAAHEHPSRFDILTLRSASVSEG